MSSNPYVLTVMAHPDDAEILVGGTLFHLKKAGWDTGIVTMTSGDLGSATETTEEISRTRYKEAQAAADYLGADYKCAGFMDFEIFANADNVRSLTEVLREFDPDVVITHSPRDYIVDHEETARLVRAATFAMAVPLYQTRWVPPTAVTEEMSTPAVYYADPVEGVDPLGERIYPQFYVDVSSEIDNKADMLSRHESQREWLRSHHGMDEYLRRMRRWGQKYGEECGADYAEGLRQHLGHGYPQDKLVQQALEAHVRVRN